MPEQVMTDLRKFEAPTVVVQLTWSLPTTCFDESASGFVNAITSPSEFDCRDFVFVLRMWMKVEPLSSSVNVSVRPLWAEAPGPSRTAAATMAGRARNATNRL